MTAKRSWVPGPGELYFLPLGGTGEIGMNLNLYGHDGAWLMVDLGITFADAGAPGFDILMADPAFIVERREALAGLVLTHAHEDHIGAVPYLWPQLRCPIYATPFTATLVRGKLAEAGLEGEAELIEVPLSGRFEVGPFGIELITLTHSIPEPNALVIRTPAGTVLHTGDWKLDPEPLVGAGYDEAALRGLADEGVLAMVCDSTNALVPGTTGSEGDVRATLQRLVAGLDNRVALVGRSLHRIHRAAKENGYLAGLPPLISDKDVGYLPRDEVLLLCTGSQGEPRGALWRIARGEHPDVGLDPGDAVIFSSRVIPGNETSIYALQNTLVGQGVAVLTDRDAPIHVSGHPARDELTEMYQWVRPQISIPVHGEARHLAAHAEIARDCQIPEVLVGHNGALMRLAPDPAKIVEAVSTGRLVLDGERLLPASTPLLRERKRMLHNGMVLVTLVVDRKGALRGEPQISCSGVLDADGDAEVLAVLRSAVENALGRLAAGARRDDGQLAEAGRLAVRRHLSKAIGKKPLTQVHVVRLT